MRLFVTGTDTDVGKTVVTGCLAAAARRVGPTLAAKPVASGVAPGTPGDDAAFLGRCGGHPPCVFATFEAPLSPHRAAALEGRALPADLLARVEALDAANVLVEGVGGWCVPLGAGLWVADLARASRGPVVVVAADRLGVINHTLLTLAAVRDAGFPVVGVVLNRHGARPDDRSTASNADDLRALAGVPVATVGTVAPGDEGRVGAEVSAALGVIWSPAKEMPCPPSGSA